MPAVSRIDEIGILYKEEKLANSLLIPVSSVLIHFNLATISYITEWLESFGKLKSE